MDPIWDDCSYNHRKVPQFLASGALWSICKEVWLIPEICLFAKLGINLISLGTITQIKCKQLFTSIIMLKILN